MQSLVSEYSAPYSQHGLRTLAQLILRGINPFLLEDKIMFYAIIKTFHKVFIQ